MGKYIARQYVSHSFELFCRVICYLGRGGPREERRDKKDSDSNEIQLDIEMNHASQILNAFTMCGCWVDQRIIEF